MNRALGLVAVLSSALAIVVYAQAPAEKKDEKKDTKEVAKAEASVDVTAKVKEMNSDKFVAPPTKFRPGNVADRGFDEKAIVATQTGFSVQFPGKSPIPTPTWYKGKLYVSGGFHSKEFFCFDAQTGRVIWSKNLDDDGPTSAVVEDDVVVFNTESCTIFALDAGTGKLLWSYFLGDPLTSTPTIAGGKVFTSYPANGLGEANNAPGIPAKQRTTASHVLACFELKSGKILWQRWIDSDVMSAPIAVDDEIYATSFGGTVYRVKQADGAIISAHANRATSAPVIVGGSVYVTQRADNGKNEKAAESVRGIDRKTAEQNFAGEKKEATYLDAEVQGNSALKKQAEKLDAGNGFGGVAPAAANAPVANTNLGIANVYSMQAWQGSRVLNYKDSNFNCMGDEIVCTDPKDGRTRWSVKLKGDLAKQGGHLAAPPAAAGGRIFLATLEGNVLQIDPEKGTLEKAHRIGFPLRTQPAIVGGKLYVGTDGGQLICVDLGDARFTGWTTWGANSAHTNLPAKD
jgi:Ca-activated chloride channel family protein